MCFGIAKLFRNDLNGSSEAALGERVALLGAALPLG